MDFPLSKSSQELPSRWTPVSVSPESSAVSFSLLIRHDMTLKLLDFSTQHVRNAVRRFCWINWSLLWRQRALTNCKINGLWLVWDRWFLLRYVLSGRMTDFKRLNISQRKNSIHTRCHWNQGVFLDQVTMMLPFRKFRDVPLKQHTTATPSYPLNRFLTTIRRNQ